MSTDVCYTYAPDKNPDATYLPGVPLRDLTEDDLRRLSPHLAASVAECAFYTAGPGRVPADVQEAIATWKAATGPASDDSEEATTAAMPTASADATPAAVGIAKAKQPKPSETKSNSSGE